MSSEARHKKRMLIGAVHEATVWKASPQPGLRAPSAFRDLRALPDALWTKSEPFSSYRPKLGRRKRDANPGPHADFLELKELLEDGDSRFNNEADLFATKHGLLGLFNYEYSPPVPPRGKALIAPEAVIEGGRLRYVCPATEGLELLARMRDEHLPSGWRSPGGRPLTEQLHRLHEAVAMPEEVSFVRKALHQKGDEFAPAPGGYVPWLEAREGYDAILVLDSANVWGTGISVLTRREDIFSWEVALQDFPAPPYEKEQRAALCRYLARHVTSIALAPGTDENGDATPGWRCNTLLESMHLMLYLDIMGGLDLRVCGLRDCSQYFRPGPHDAKYCCEEHTSQSSSRGLRERES